MFPRKTMLAATVAAALAVTPAAFAMPADDLRGEAAATGGTAAAELPRTWPSYPTPLPQPVDSAPLAVADEDDELPVVLLGAAGTLALAGGIGMIVMRPRVRTAR